MNKQTGTLLFAYQTIADMEVKIIEQADKIAELEAELAKLQGDYMDIEANQARRDLEMKSQGVSDAAWYLSDSDVDAVYKTSLYGYAAKLRKQASDL